MARNASFIILETQPAVTECIAASGYQFLKGTLPTVAQYRIMCRNSACMEVVNGLVMSGWQIPSFDMDVRPTLDALVFPMIGFCYFHHVPTEPCPADFLTQFFSDLKVLVNACEKKSGFSFATLPPAVAYDGENQKLLRVLCNVDECDNLLKRLHVKFFVEQCQPFRVYSPVQQRFLLPPEFEAVTSQLVRPYLDECKVRRGDSPLWDIPSIFPGTEFTFVELPGPLPGDTPSVTTSPPPPPLTLEPTTTLPAPSLITPPPTPPILTAEPTTSSTLSPTSSTPSSSSAPVVPFNKPVQGPSTQQPTLAPPVVPTLLADPLVVTSNDPPSQNRGGHNATVRSSTPPVAFSTDGVSTLAPRPTDAAVINDVSTQSSNAGTTNLLSGVGIGAGAVVVLLLVFLLVFRRKRTLEPSKDGYELFEGSAASTETNQGGADSASPRHTELVSCREIPVHELEDVRIIGGGGFGIVYLVRYAGIKTTPGPHLLASKRINKDNHSNDQLDAFIREISLAATLSHPRIVTFVGIAGLRKTELQALFEYMAGGDLKRYLDCQPPLNPTSHSWTPEKLQIAIDIADALAYLHTLEPTPVVHRDLKSRNIMLTSENRAKLGDFGVSRTESAAGSMTTGVGTSRWVAPEVILGGGDYTTACDVYSFGVVLSELDTHRLPFSDLVHANGEQLADFVVLPMVMTERKQPSFSDACPPNILALAQNCLAFEPADRPNAGTIAEALRMAQYGFGWEPVERDC